MINLPYQKLPPNYGKHNNKHTWVLKYSTLLSGVQLGIFGCNSVLSASVPGQGGTEHVPDPAPVSGHSFKTQDAETCKWVEPWILGIIPNFARFFTIIVPFSWSPYTCYSDFLAFLIPVPLLFLFQFTPLLLFCFPPHFQFGPFPFSFYSAFPLPLPSS